VLRAAGDKAGLVGGPYLVSEKTLARHSWQSKNSVQRFLKLNLQRRYRTRLTLNSDIKTGSLMEIIAATQQIAKPEVNAAVLGCVSEIPIFYRIL